MLYQPYQPYQPSYQSEPEPEEELEDAVPEGDGDQEEEEGEEAQAAWLRIAARLSQALAPLPAADEAVDESAQERAAPLSPTVGRDAFMRALGRYPLLTRAQEVALSKAVRGDQTGAEEAQLLAALRVASARDAEHRLVEHNLRLVVSRVQDYLRGSPGVGSLDFDDLVQASSVGLMRAARRFDWRRGYRFSTFAIWWIRQALGREIDDSSHMIHAPVHAWTSLRKVARAERQLAGELGHAPSDAELMAAPEAGIDAHVLAHARAAERLVRGNLLSLDRDVTHHDARRADTGARSTQLADLVIDENAEGEMVERAERHDTFARLRALMRHVLSPREYVILCLRYGLALDDPDDLGILAEVNADVHARAHGTPGEQQSGQGQGQPRSWAPQPSTSEQTLLQVGERLNITRERVRQIEAHAKRKLLAAGLQPDGSFGAFGSQTDAAEEAS